MKYFLKTFIGELLRRRQQALAQDIQEGKASALLDITGMLMDCHDLLVVCILLPYLELHNLNHPFELGEGVLTAKGG